ncbi:MAG: vWA domain-containing protein [Polaromonas sp.]
MLIDFFYTLRSAKLPVSVKEYLMLMEALQAGVVGPNSAPTHNDDQGSEEEGAYKIDDFYYLSRTILVKDEKHYDKFDRAFAAYFKGVEMVADFTKEVPLEWLRKNLELELSPEDKAKIEKMGWDELMETLKKRFEEQKERHEGGSKWIGTGGTSPFGANGFNPQGIRIGQEKSRNKSAVKVWDQRAYKDYDDTQELGTRNIKVALRRLRKFARLGSAEELDLDDTIHSTAANAGWLDIKMVPERHNNVKVLLLMDVGGTMDEHIHRVEEMFSAVKSEFKHLEFYYFHNCVYDFMWKNNRRRFSEKFATWDILRKYNKDYKLIFVGDATMSPYEILQPGGSVEYNNEESGAEWMQRLTTTFPKFAWINPEPQGVWQYRQSISVMQQLVQQRMYPLTVKGLEDAMRQLSK